MRRAGHQRAGAAQVDSSREQRSNVLLLGKIKKQFGIRQITGGDAEVIHQRCEATSTLDAKVAALEAKLLNTLNPTSELADLKAKLLNTTSELADLKAKVAALLKTQSQTSPASGSLVGTLLALSLTAAAVA